MNVDYNSAAAQSRIIFNSHEEQEDLMLGLPQVVIYPLSLQLYCRAINSTFFLQLHQTPHGSVVSTSYLQFRLLESLGIWLPGRMFVEGFTFPLQAVDSDLHCTSPAFSCILCVNHWVQFYCLRAGCHCLA